MTRCRLVSPAQADDARFIAALKPLIGKLAVERMRAANYMVTSRCGETEPAEAARWLDPR